MLKIQKIILDWLFPITCINCQTKGRAICQSCLDSIPINNYFNNNFLIASNYNNPLLKQAIKKFKYSPGFFLLAKELSFLLIKYLSQFPTTIEYLKNQHFILVPIPLSNKKKRLRGFNQSELIAKELSKKFNLKINTTILLKTKETKSQTKLNSQARKINLSNCFEVDNKQCPNNILLIDDILTTGTTIKQTSVELKKRGAKKIWTIILAKS